jgi:hypothetical protein
VQVPSALGVICHPEPVGAGGSGVAATGGGGFVGVVAVVEGSGVDCAVGGEAVVDGLGPSVVGAIAAGGADSQAGRAATVRTNDAANFLVRFIVGHSITSGLFHRRWSGSHA